MLLSKTYIAFRMVKNVLPWKLRSSVFLQDLREKPPPTHLLAKTKCHLSSMININELVFVEKSDNCPKSDASFGMPEKWEGPECASRGTDTHCADTFPTLKTNLTSIKYEHSKQTRLCKLKVRISVPKEWVLSALQTEGFMCSLATINRLQRRTVRSKDIDWTDRTNS